MFDIAALPAFPPVQPDTATQMDAAKTAKLADGAQQFEAMLLQQMLKPLQFGAAPGADDTDVGAADTIRSLGTEAMSKAIAKAGGFGVAKQIVRQVSAQHQRSVAQENSPKV